MSTENNKLYEEKGNKSFEVFKNALSVGWHLRKIQEADPTFMDDPKDTEKFLQWMKRHQLIK